MKIRGRDIGKDHPPYVIAEAGVHAGRNFDIAQHYVVAAKIAGADAIKFQAYTAAELATAAAPAYWQTGPLSQRDVFEGTETDEHFVRMVTAYAHTIGIACIWTPFDKHWLSVCLDAGMDAIKVASADITNGPLLRAIGESQRDADSPCVIMSMGASSYDDVADAYDLCFFDALLHCSLAYPTPIDNANVRRLADENFLQYGAHMGYSCHVPGEDGIDACVIAVALGATIIEKHFTLNKHGSGDDHYHAVDADGLARLVRRTRNAWAACRPREGADIEAPARLNARRSLVFARDLPAGHVIDCDADLAAKRPGTGISPMRWREFHGRKLVCDVKADELLDEGQSGESAA